MVHIHVEQEVHPATAPGMGNTLSTIADSFVHVQPIFYLFLPFIIPLTFVPLRVTSTLPMVAVQAFVVNNKVKSPHDALRYPSHLLHEQSGTPRCVARLVIN